jgi:20S proteasome alpha/beta subunit
MTFVVGLTCTDGLVLCTDSLEDDNITKRPVDKIHRMGTTEWGIAMAGAGPGSTINKLWDELATKLNEPVPFNKAYVESEIEKTLTEFGSKYVVSTDDNFHVIVAAYDRPTIFHRLYQGSCLYGQSVVLSPIRHDCRIGMGHELWALLSDVLYEDKNSVEDNVRLAIFATQLAIEYASGVDEPIQLLSYSVGDGMWATYRPSTISAIQSELPLDGFKKSIQDYWRRNNPPTFTTQVQKYRSWKSGGQDDLTLLDGVKVEELCTIAGRLRASKTFRRNEDKLQQRAHLERERYQAAHLGASPSSRGNSRT